MDDTVITKESLVELQRLMEQVIKTSEESEHLTRHDTRNWVEAYEDMTSKERDLKRRKRS